MPTGKDRTHVNEAVMRKDAPSQYDPQMADDPASGLIAIPAALHVSRPTAGCWFCLPLAVVSVG